jgi:hypothetical protein
LEAVRTSTTNCILKGCSEDVFDLPVTRLEYPDGTKAVESCWELSIEEIDEIARTGKIYFLCLGTTHPPIMLKVEPEIKEE